MFIFVIYYVIDSSCPSCKFILLGWRSVNKIILSRDNHIFRSCSAFVTASWYLFIECLILRIKYFHRFERAISRRLIFSFHNKVIFQMHIRCAYYFFLVWEWEVGLRLLFCHYLSWCFFLFSPRCAFFFSAVSILSSGLGWFFLNFYSFCIIACCVFLCVHSVFRCLSGTFTLKLIIWLFSFHSCKLLYIGF